MSGLNIDLDKRLPTNATINRDDVKQTKCNRCGQDLMHDISQNKFLCIKCDGDKFTKPTLIADDGSAYKPQTPFCS